VPFVIAKPAALITILFMYEMYGAGPYPKGYSYPADYKAKYPAYR
jgi:hypothetical protein